VTGLVIVTYLIGSWWVLGPGVTWELYSDELMFRAQELNKPVILDFSAAWCAPCRELDDVTFRDPEIVKRAERDFVMVKVDLTRKGEPVHQRLVRQYEVKGVPTVVFLDSRGQERPDLRLVDFLPADPFLGRMTQLVKETASASAAIQ
jgi:thiol:disulfide interchange protein DsbD